MDLDNERSSFLHCTVLYVYGALRVHFMALEHHCQLATLVLYDAPITRRGEMLLESE
jgi:hypothetical protein